LSDKATKKGLVEFVCKKKMQFLLLGLSLILWPALVSSQSLVLVGGALADDNAAIWNKVVELAVSNQILNEITFKSK
jgi:hypothetical protein